MLLCLQYPVISSTLRCSDVPPDCRCLSAGIAAFYMENRFPVSSAVRQRHIREIEGTHYYVVT